ncbi:MAG: type II secretion system protein [Candidatus Pacebacteria bacterium]|nr:type II secretion system protein [Candidatus Paceibacterota bacterium]MDD5357096.1 type II secretion system protein [Candidatus Paceibacterota bacterium]
MNKKKGFTLIELLVVIAIIGILSAIVLASLSTARNKGKQASAIGSLSSMRAQAELTNNNGTYASDLCTNGLNNLVVAANAQAGAGKTKCGISTDLYSWAAEVDLTGIGGAGGASYFCVDSTGAATSTSATSITTGTGSGDVICG